MDEEVQNEFPLEFILEFFRSVKIVFYFHTLITQARNDTFFWLEFYHKMDSYTYNYKGNIAYLICQTVVKPNCLNIGNRKILELKLY